MPTHHLKLRHTYHLDIIYCSGGYRPLKFHRNLEPDDCNPQSTHSIPRKIVRFHNFWIEKKVNPTCESQEISPKPYNDDMIEHSGCSTYLVSIIRTWSEFQLGEIQATSRKKGAAVLYDRVRTKKPILYSQGLHALLYVKPCRCWKIRAHTGLRPLTNTSKLD